MHIGLEPALTMKKLFLTVFSLSVTLGTIGDAKAHHSFQIYDLSKTSTINGTVRKFSWQNPHPMIDIVLDSGEVWSVECSSPNILARRGWRRDSLVVGDKITMTIHPTRSGSRSGAVSTLTTKGGELLSDPH
jgi:hypothetical protein